MRFSHSLPAVLFSAFALAAATGCHTPQRVKYDVDGNAVAVEEPTYQPVTHETPAPAVEVIKQEPAPAAAPAPAPAPAPVAAQPEAQPAEKPAAVAPASKPHGEHKATHAAAGKPGGTYVVQKGDTLQKISDKVYGTTKRWKAIMRANNLVDDKIRVGQKLVLPEAK